MKTLIRLIAFTVIIILGTQSALESCVHISSTSIHLSSASHHSSDSTPQDAPTSCHCSPTCNLTLKINDEALPLMISLNDQNIQNSYPENHLTSKQFYPLLIKPPIA